MYQPYCELRIKAPCYIALADIKSFTRLVCALERAPIPAFSLTFGGKNVLAVQLDVIDGRPVIYYVEAEVGDAQYLAYRESNGVEEVILANSVGNPTFVYAPIIKVDEMPQSLARAARIDKKSGYVAIRLRDLASLAKVAAYKTVYEEAPLPLFLFKEQGKVILGTHMSMNDNDSFSYFYYVLLNVEPAGTFLRYASQKAEQPSFTSSLAEHGFIYLKVIRLADSHPLVKVYD
jgi:hypothetical protein